MLKGVKMSTPVSSQNLPVNCSDPVIPVYTYQWDGPVPPAYPQIQYVVASEPSYTSPASASAPAPSTPSSSGNGK